MARKIFTRKTRKTRSNRVNSISNSIFVPQFQPKVGIWNLERRTPNHAKEPDVKTPNKKFRDIYSPNRKLFQKFSAKGNVFLEIF
jgi:hypothetical protein